MPHARHVATPVLSLLLAAPVLAADSSTALTLTWTDEPQRLEDMVITGRHNPLDDVYLRLRQLLEAGVPCLGCDAERAIAAVLTPPRFIQANVMPERDTVERFMFEVRCMDATPATEYRC